MEEKRKKNKISWSDDLSYDSEEEREKERLLAAELAEIETPEKPSYSDDELQRLVDFIKRMTTLCNLSSDDWNDECDEVMKEFFMEPKCVILVLHFDDDHILKALLRVPERPVYDFTYFLREPDFIFSVENFHDEVTFGTIIESSEGILLKTIEYVYAPVFFATLSWPHVVKSELCAQLHTFLAKLTDLHYKQLGLTVLYVPREGLQFLAAEANHCGREVIRRLEAVVVYWIHQVQSCVEDQDAAPVSRELVCPSDELDFWIYRYDNLNSLNKQIKNQGVNHIIDILINCSSAYIKQFQKLVLRIEECMREATSNISFLQIVKEPCDKMEAVKNPNEIYKLISTILNTFRFIWTESPYYNTKTRMTNLCSYLSNQVIIQCSVSIDLKSLFSGKTKVAMEQLRSCIDCCGTYREIYDAVSEAHNEMEPGSWELDNEKIFNYIDSFVQRCVDMLQVCNSMIIFGRIDEVEEMPKPKFGGTKGLIYETVCEKVENLFIDGISKIEQSQENILNVQAASWYENILQFRATTQQIEIIIESLLTTVFDTLNNVEEGVQVLCSMYNYSKRVNLKRVFEQKTVQVWNMLDSEIEDLKRSMVSERSRFPAELPAFSGKAVVSYIRKHRMNYLRELVDSAAWMVPCGIVGNKSEQFGTLMAAVDITEKYTWKSWMKLVDENIENNNLNRELICESASKVQLLECNVERKFLEIWCEVYHWQNIECEIPAHALKIYAMTEGTRLIYEDILSMVKKYNRILTSLSMEERQLFKPLINECKSKVSAGIVTLEWSSPVEKLNIYIEDCMRSIAELQSFLDCYKSCNLSIAKLLEKIWTTPLITFAIYQPIELQAFKDKIRCMWMEALEQLLKMYAQIVDYLVIVFEGFEDYIDEIPYQWLHYIRKYDALLENALRYNVKVSLQNMSKFVIGDGTTGPISLLKMKAVLENSLIRFVPAHEDILNVFSSTFKTLATLVKRIPRLCGRISLPKSGLNKFHIVVEQDLVCRKLHQNIVNETSVALRMAFDHARVWEQYKHIWLVDKELFFGEYVSQSPSSRDYDKDISRYNDLANNIQMQESIVHIHFLVLDYVELKRTIIQHCNHWQQSFIANLSRITRRNFQAVFTYVKQSADAEAHRHTAALLELQESLENYQRICEEILQKDREFVPILEQMEALDKIK